MTLTEPWVQRWQWLRCVAGCRICLGLYPTGERLAQRGAGNATIALPPQRRVQQRDRVALCRIIEQRIQRLSCRAPTQRGVDAGPIVICRSEGSSVGKEWFSKWR